MNILKKIKPTKEEAEITTKLINLFLLELRNRIRGADISIGGSFAKGTWLKGNYDIDIFIKFDYNKYKSKDISKIVENKINNFKFKKLHGSRTYFQIFKNNLIFELVPVLKINNSSTILNVMDISPLHTEYIKHNTNLILRDEIRIAKAFFKANNLYGAETFQKGFSGYAIEVLTLHYKGFLNLLKATSKWQQSEVIDHEKHYNNKKEILLLLNKSKLISPLIVIDPVQKDRNITAVLSKKNYESFKILARSYLKSQSEEYFTAKDQDINKLKGYIIVELLPKQEPRNVIGGKLARIIDYIKKHLELEQFSVIDYGSKWDNKFYIWYKIKQENLSSKIKHYGPSIDDTENLKKFKQRWNKTKIIKENNKVFVYTNRKFKKAIDLVKFLLKDSSIAKVYSKSFVYQIK